MTSEGRPLHAPPTQDLVLAVRVVLDEAVPPISRDLELRGGLTLDRVHAVLQAAMGWEDYHLHSFFHGEHAYDPDPPRYLTTVDLAEGEEGLPESEVRLDQVLRRPGDRLGYVYDFGDDWLHSLTLDGVRPASSHDEDASCRAGEGACPPEDVGGMHQYNSLAAGLRGDPQHADLAQEYHEWLRPGFEPDYFDVAAANQAVRDAAARSGSVHALMASPLQPLRNLVERLGRDDVSRIVRLFEQAGQAPSPSPSEITTALRPWQVILDLAGTEGIPLTGAGWMKPVVVEEIATTLGIDRWWIGKVNREDLTAPVAELRESAQQAKLLRKSKGRLLRTPAGRRATGDEEALWASLVAALPLGRGRYEQDAGALYLLCLAAGVDDHAAVCADLLTAAGWRIQGGVPISRQAVSHGVADTAGLFAVIGAAFRSENLWEPVDPAARRVARALAARAVRG